jgi:hypothetical protein
MPNCPQREHHFSPPFCHISTTYCLVCAIFTWVVYILFKNTIATKMGQNGAVLGEIPHFGTFPWEKIRKKGCQKEWKTKFHQTRFSATQKIPHHIYSTPVVGGAWAVPVHSVQEKHAQRTHRVPHNYDSSWHFNIWGEHIFEHKSILTETFL